MSGRRREQLVDIAQWGDVRSLVEDDEQRRVEGLAETRSLLERDIERLADKGDEDRAESSLISRWRTAVERARSIAQQPASLEPPARTLGVGNVWIGISGDHRLRGGIDRGALALFHREARASDAGGVALAGELESQERFVDRLLIEPLASAAARRRGAISRSAAAYQ